MTNTMRLIVLIWGVALLAGCDQAQGPATSAQSADILTGTESMRDFGDYVVYVNALTTDRLTPEVAREYGVVRSPGNSLLTFSVHRKQDVGLPVAVTGTHTATAVNLTGQLRNVMLREITEAEAVYYIGELEVSDEETLTYSISFTPDGESSPLEWRFQRQFFVEGPE